MRFNTALSFAISTHGLTEKLSDAFYLAPKGEVVTSTSLLARRNMFPVLRRSRPSLFFPDIDRMFEEMDEMVEKSFALIEKPLSIKDRNFSKDPIVIYPSGFDLDKDKNQYKLSLNVPGVKAEDLKLQLDLDGRVLKIKGERNQEEAGMKIQSRFEKSILLGPNLDSTKIVANVSDGVLTIIAPKIEEPTMANKLDSNDNDINLEDQEKGSKDQEVSIGSDRVVTRLAVEELKDETEERKKPAPINEKRWPAKDFPY